MDRTLNRRFEEILTNLSTVDFNEPILACIFSKTSSIVPMDDACRKRTGALFETLTNRMCHSLKILFFILLVALFLHLMFVLIHLNVVNNQ